MNCKFCGYYYSSREQGTICHHCGGNREGLTVTRLMRLTKVLAAAAFVIPVIVYLSCFISGSIDLEFEFKRFFHKLAPEEAEGHSGADNFNGIFIFNTVISSLIAITTLFRSKKSNSGLYILSAVILILPAVFMLFTGESVFYFFIYTLPCMLFIAAAVISEIDKKQQIKEFKIRNSKERENYD